MKNQLIYCVDDKPPSRFEKWWVGSAWCADRVIYLTGLSLVLLLVVHGAIHITYDLSGHDFRHYDPGSRLICWAYLRRPGCFDIVDTYNTDLQYIEPDYDRLRDHAAMPNVVSPINDPNPGKRSRAGDAASRFRPTRSKGDTP